MRRVCVYCGSSRGARPVFAEAARRMGETLVRRGIGLVFGGGHIGLMGVTADAVLSAGGDLIGVIPQALVARELAHPRVAEMRIVGSMHERKALMAELSDGFVALPGGYGTLDEFCEMVTWGQLGLHAKPCGLLNVDGYYNPFVALLDRAVAEGFIRPEHRELVLVEDDPDRLLDLMAAFRPPPVEKWLGMEDV